MKKSNISILLVSGGKNPSIHIDIGSVVFALVIFAVVVCFSGVLLYSHFLPSEYTVNDVPQVSSQPSVQLLSCKDTEDNDGEEDGKLDTENLVIKLQELEKNLADMKKLLKQKGIGESFFIGGTYLQSNDSEKLSDEYIDSISNGVKDLSRILRVYPLGVPVDGPVSSNYGYRIDPFKKKRAFHSGVDFSPPYGEPVKSTADGVVEIAGWKGGYGKSVVIKHENGYKTLYGHLSKINVVKGQKVLCGEKVGEIGSTGRSTGPHLHYEVIKKGKKVNPKKYLNIG